MAVQLKVRNTFYTLEAPKVQRQVSAPAELGPTTAMLRNLSTSCSLQSLIDLLDQNGFKSTYDFIYVPMKMLSDMSFGYAFVNFVSPEEARSFQVHFQGLIFDGQKLQVEWSKVQGLHSNVERYRNSPVMHPSRPVASKPMVFKGGQAVPFPLPTQKIRAPKPRACRSRAPAVL